MDALRNYNDMAAIISRLETIEQTIESLNISIRQISYHFNGDYDIISRLDTLENQGASSAIDKAVFGTKLTTHKKEQTKQLELLSNELNGIREEFEESKNTIAASICEYSGTAECSISNIRAELSLMQSKFVAAAVTETTPPNEEQHAGDGDSDEAWCQGPKAQDSPPASVTSDDEAWGDEPVATETITKDDGTDGV
jgi:hypothetical protein